MPNKPVGTFLSRNWRQVIKNTPVGGKVLRFDPLSRLSGYETAGEEKILLKLQRTNYRDFLLTNLLLTVPVVPMSQGQPYRSIWELGHADMEQCLPYLANPLNVIAMVQTKAGFSQIVETFSKQSQRLDFPCFECVKLEEENLEAIATSLRSKEWSQPSDQAAVLLVVIRKFGKNKVLQAFRAIGA